MLPALFFPLVLAGPVLERRFAAAIARVPRVPTAAAAPAKESPGSVESVGAASAAESRQRNTIVSSGNQQAVRTVASAKHRRTGGRRARQRGVPEVTVSQAARQRTGEIDTSRVDEQPRKEHKGDEGDEGARGLAEHVADGLGVVDRADEGEAGGPDFVAAVVWTFCAHNRNGAFRISACSGRHAASRMRETLGLRLSLRRGIARASHDLRRDNAAFVDPLIKNA